MAPRPRRPTHGTVVAYLALFVALGGTSYAALKLPEDSVGNKQLRDGAVTGKKVKNRSLRAKDFAKDELPEGPRGATGAAGQTGARGATGSAAASMIMGFVAASHISNFEGEGAEYPPSGNALGSSESGLMPAPNHTIALRDLVVRLTNSPTPGSRTFYLGDGELSLPPSPAISCVVPSGATACNTGAQTVTIPAGRYMSFAIQNGGGMDPHATSVSFSYRATAP